ncbi:MAG: DUF4886 domain-containing protein [Clostridia bacterium]|nr:DUF4886 domain-containing protein [Clostridia bacterium]MBQ7122103.1 DUF4886 domain-containing protein [Clostridia bacterium]
MNVLSIGNSFSNNAHRFLPKMAQADGAELMLCNLYIGGCSLETHWNNWREEKTDYEYEIYLPFETEMTKATEVALHEAVEDEEWDVITLQQCSPLSGIRESYSPYLSELAEYCRMVQPRAKIMLHQTWAYDKNCPLTAFANYGRSQQEMYRMLTEAYVDAALEADIGIIIPSGRAWQTVRNTIGDKLTEVDGYHGNDLGCYLAGACFYETIFGKSIYDNTFEIPDVDKGIMETLKICAHTAVEKGIIRNGY